MPKNIYNWRRLNIDLDYWGLQVEKVECHWIVLLNIFVETVINVFFVIVVVQDSLINRKLKYKNNSIYLEYKFFVINVFTVTFDQFDASLLKKISSLP